MSSYLNLSLTILGCALSPVAAQAGDLACTTAQKLDMRHVGIAEIKAGSAEHVYLHPRHPATCSETDAQTCNGSAYVLSGDHVQSGPDCQGWSLVTYTGKTKSTTGWVRTAQLRPASADPICKQAETMLNVALEHEPSVSNLPSAVTSGISVERFPPGIGLDPKTESVWDRKVADLTLSGKPVKVISYGAGGTCHDDFVELWNGDFKRRIAVNQHNNYDDIDANDDDPASADPADWGGYSGEQIVNVGGTPYFMHFSRSSRYIKMYGFKEDLTSELRCEFVLRPRDQYKVIQAADPDLCESVASGKAEVLNDAEAPSTAVDEQVFGPKKDNSWYGGTPFYTLTQPFLIDLYNDGKPVPVAIATESIDSGAGCGHEFESAWPVVVGADGKPDLSYPPVASVGQGVRLIRFKGQTYLDNEVSDDEGGDNSEAISARPMTHEVGRLSRDGYTKMCTLQTRMYVSRSPSD